MKLLVLSPDYASHYGPLAVLAGAARRAGHRVVVATGPAMRNRVLADGFEHRELRLGRGSNDGTTAADRSLDGFFDATRRGAVATLRHQAEERSRDLLHEPVRTSRRVFDLLATEGPDVALVDHVSVGSTLAMHASGEPFISLVPGHPSQLPLGPERYGVPATWPEAVRPPAEAVEQLTALADRTTERFTAAWNEALQTLAPHRSPVADAFRVHGRRVLYNSDRSHHDPLRTPSLPANLRFVGPLVRDEDLPPALRSWAVDDGRPRIYVALGTFLSRRDDVLVKIVAALRRVDGRVAVACGSTPTDELGPLPAGWIVAPHLPQVALLDHADIAVCHGGNNSVQEARHAGVPQVILPFSTDQFSIGADAERCGSGRVLDPNHLDGRELVATVARFVASGRACGQPRPTDRELVDALGLDLDPDPDPARSVPTGAFAAAPGPSA